MGAPGTAEAVGEPAGTAVGLGVRRPVLLSARGEDQALPTEEALRASGAHRTVVRAAWFAQNFSEGPPAAEVRAGELVFPAGGVAEPFVAVRDVAEVVVAALTGGGRYAGRRLSVTGPRPLTWAEAVAEIAAATGRPLTYRAVPARDHGEALVGPGVPREEAAFLTEVSETLLDGRNAYPEDGVRQVLGREPRDFAGFVAQEAAAGTWEA
ncbi:NmrA family transcriptional regulator [Streptomyces caelestis]|uniref:NmrA family transcriptional regulator n=1 Tax=Streptomyces caelestis TaxID=36816 RepID=UPI00365D4FA5